MPHSFTTQGCQVLVDMHGRSVRDILSILFWSDIEVNIEGSVVQALLKVKTSMETASCNLLDLLISSQLINAVW